MFLETTIKGQSFQVVLDNEAFFSSVKQTGFYIVLPFGKEGNPQIQITNRHVSLAFTNYTKKLKEQEWTSVFIGDHVYSQRKHITGCHRGKHPFNKRDIYAQNSVLKSELFYKMKI